MPVITHIEIRVALSQLVSQFCRKHPFIIIGSVLHKGNNCPFYHFQIRLRL